MGSFSSWILFVIAAWTVTSTGVVVSAQKCEVEPNLRFNCHPEIIGFGRENCLKRGCCWDERQSATGGQEEFKSRLNTYDGKVPQCYYSSDFPSYTVTKQQEKPFGYTLDLSRKSQSYYPKDVMQLTADVFFETKTRLHVKIYDSEKPRYEVPLDTPKVSTKAKSTDYSVNFGETPFSVQVKRQATDTTLIDTSVNPAFIFSDQFLQISTKLPSTFIYGLGEHRHSLLLDLNWTSFTFWNHDMSPAPLVNLYGSHPFYMMLEEDGNSHGVFLLNSNGMDVILQPTPALTWRTIGGILDFYIFLGPSPDEVIQQYSEVIGLPFMPPYWSLGFHLCRYGYNSANKTREIWQSMLKAGIPQDVQWNDIDSMEGHRDFTYNQETFTELPALVEEIHQHNQYYITMLDPGIPNDQPKGSYRPYEDGIELGVFVKDYQGNPFVGRVWPGRTVFPDYTNPVTVKWWQQETQRFHDKIKFDGLWNDMNEPSNFVYGAAGFGCPIDSPYDYPPYVPNVFGFVLGDRTICPSAQHNLSLHYDVHNIYGLTEVIATYNALKNIRGKRPFVLSRSTFAGSGKYTAHWTGDNLSSWVDLYYSIPAILNLNMFGIPLVGVDICGFEGDTTEELCQRWQQVGAFYPFSRNHNAIGSKDQHPTVFSQDMQASTRKALLIRYTLLPYLYTLFHRANAGGKTVARPLFFEYPSDRSTYSIDKQFLWGEALLITPVLQLSVVQVTGYFPKDTWYDYYTGMSIESEGQQITLDAPLDKINLHIRGGYIIPTQQPNVTTFAARKNPFGLIVALSGEGIANGSIYWDDGDSLDTFKNKKHNAIKFTAAKNSITCRVVHDGYSEEPMVLGSVRVLGVANKPETVTANSKAVPFSYDVVNKVLKLDVLSLLLTKPFMIAWT
ncbi:lysosomal alpha-glucosidase-like [Ptychodera flava]|uniref:lysosomal alpha-glucosidase-like n=1 Tax=Ptychodera flava TaxID=63121 RepID=UPI00396A8C05